MLIPFISIQNIGLISKSFQTNEKKVPYKKYKPSTAIFYFKYLFFCIRTRRPALTSQSEIDSQLTDTSTDLLSELLGLGLLYLGHLGGGLVPEAAATPVLADLLAPLVKVSLHRLDKLVQRAAVIRLNLEIITKI